MVRVSVEARVLGTRLETGIGVVELELQANRMRVSDLVRVTVEEQVRTLTARRRLTAYDIEQHLRRQYGTAGQESGPREFNLKVPELDPEREVERALNACRRGKCLVVIDRQPVTDLDEEIVLEPGARVRFLRLLPLAGG